MESNAGARTPSQIARDSFRVLFDERDLSDPYRFWSEDSIDVMRFDDDGRIDENTIYYDGAEFARQVGMLPPRDSAADRATLAAFNLKTRLAQRLGRVR